MNNKLLKGLVAAALATTLALASPAFARGGGGGGGGHGGGGGGGHGGGMGGGHFGGGGMGGGGGMHFSGGMGGSGAHFAGVGGAHFAGRSFASAQFAHAGVSPRFAFHNGFHNGRFFHHHRRFAFIGAPYAYAGYDDCWRRVWTPYGLQWANVCYGNYY